MGRGRGRGQGSRGRGRGYLRKIGHSAQTPEDEEEVVDTDIVKPEPVVTRTVMQKLEKSLRRTENDEDIVECSECREEFSFRDFRLHNIKFHANTAATLEEKNGGLILDHKFFARKLTEFKKLTKAVKFDCPRFQCKATFKSTLGLAYHMNTCGRTAEELEAILIECDVCHGKFTLPQLQCHKKTHEANRVGDNRDNTGWVNSLGKVNKRKSALRARKTLKNLEVNDKQDGDEEDNSSSSDFEEEEVTPKERPAKTKTKTPKPVKPKPPTQQEKEASNDFCSYAQQFLEYLESAGLAWDEPMRNVEDIWVDVEDNSFGTVDSEDVDDYLPTHRKSIEFKHISNEGSSKYHNLTWFEGETISSSRNASSLHHAGGPVLSLSWHPSGKLLAVSVGRFCREDIDLMKCQSRQSCVQIYSSAANSLSLQLVIGISWGYATHIQWSSYCPDIMDSYNPSSKSNFEDIEIFARIGYIAMACEDSTIRIMSLRIEDLKLPPNYEYKPGHRINVYTKTPEICLKIDESVIDDELGNVCRFDWHEKNQFLAAAYANGTVAVYDLQTTSSLLMEKGGEGNSKVTVIYPFWTFLGHRLPVRGICFDPMNPRYLVTAGQDRCVKAWDIQTRMERESKKGGIASDMCWIRGWIHQAVSFECHISYQSALHNYVRIFQLGSSAGRPTLAEQLNFTSLDFYHGLTASGTDDGKVTVTYFDWFWRECDYDRNRKKKNLAILCTTKVDESSYEALSKEHFSVEFKKLAKSVWSSKPYQRLGIKEGEGVYSVTLESKFGGTEIFEPLPNPEHVLSDEEESAREEQVPNTTEGDDLTHMMNLAMLDAINAITEPKATDGFVPVYDVNIPVETPKIILSFKKQRPNSHAPTDAFTARKFEEYVRFQQHIRINKVAWSPNGNSIAVGYRNGLISLIPGKFDSIF